MDVYFFNTAWMSFNLYLAILPVIFCMFLFNVSHKSAMWLCGILWFLYLPNTIYVFTDLHHLVEQWPYVDNTGRFILIFQYSLLEIIGLTCFLIAFYPLEIIISKISLLKKYTVYILVALNFFIGLIMSLGKFERVNSWDVFLNPQFLLISTLNFLQSFELVGLGILFGLFANFFYFLFRGQAKRFCNYLNIIKN